MHKVTMIILCMIMIIIILWLLVSGFLFPLILVQFRYKCLLSPAFHVQRVALGRSRVQVINHRIILTRKG